MKVSEFMSMVEVGMSVSFSIEASKARWEESETRALKALWRSCDAGDCVSRILSSGRELIRT